jgi:hypothetical protein
MVVPGPNSGFDPSTSEFSPHTGPKSGFDTSTSEFGPFCPRCRQKIPSRIAASRGPAAYPFHMRKDRKKRFHGHFLFAGTPEGIRSKARKWERKNINGNGNLNPCLRVYIWVNRYARSYRVRDSLRDPSRVALNRRRGRKISWFRRSSIVTNRLRNYGAAGGIVEVRWIEPPIESVQTETNSNEVEYTGTAANCRKR